MWRLFNEFVVELDAKPSSWGDRLMLFVGHLVNEKKQSGTIISYISAIKAVLWENRIQISEDKFLLSALTKACRIENDVTSVRFPIHKDLLRMIISGLRKKFNNKQTQQPYLEVLYSALFATAYYGLFRIGEIMQSTHTVLAKDVHIGENKDKLFILHTSKTHGRGDKPQMIKISATKEQLQTATSGEMGGQQQQQSMMNSICPFTILKKFIQMRKSFVSGSKQYFIFRDRTPVKPEHFCAILQSVLVSRGIDSRYYSGHSFHIG